MQFFGKTNIDFLGKRHIFLIFSFVVIGVGLIGIIFLGPRKGIDFSGGTEVAVGFSKNIGTHEVRNAVTKAGFEGAEIKSFGEENQFLVRVMASKDAPTQIKTALIKAFPNVNVTILKTDKIEPKIGAELLFNALIAVILAIIAMLLYIAFRFDFVFGLGAIIALLHDVVFTYGVFVLMSRTNLLNLELDQTIIAAMLTVVGYSVNDTVIIFDRIRENKNKQKSSFNFIKLANNSINETLSRTVNTVGAVLIVLATILLLGGPVLQGFSFIMLIGVIVGTYSSVYIATAFVIWYLEKVKKMDYSDYEATIKKTPAIAKQS